MDEIAKLDLRKAGVTLKQYVLGRRDSKIDAGTLNIGRYLALDKSTGSEVYLDALRPHVILICGKRGYGKSYTMGTLIEELQTLAPEIKNNIATFVIDTMGIFWTIRHPNEKEADHLSKWGLSKHGYDAEVFVPAGNVKQYNEMQIEVRPFSISISELAGYDWCSLFRIDPLSSLGSVLIKIIDDLNESKDSFSLKDIVDAIENNENVEKNIYNAAVNYFRLAQSWGIFEAQGAGIHDIIRKGSISILDLSSLDDQGIKAIVVKIYGKKIYSERIKARRSYERMEMGKISGEPGMPMVWMFIDEAHMFLPREVETPATHVLINEWLRQGRHPGLSVVLATQRPAALHSDVVSQSDIIVCHRLTAQDDIKALEAIRPTYMREGIGDALKKLGTEKGVAFIVDDTTETAHIIRVRPRKSWHGGDEPSAFGKNLPLQSK
ncbi:MAG: ATP-binding protein [Candidatus Methanoperedens sp.]|nr:ATP-binding protein [Candidatus Methanoperedens sp.]